MINHWILISHEPWSTSEFLWASLFSIFLINHHILECPIWVHSLMNHTSGTYSSWSWLRMANKSNLFSVASSSLHGKLNQLSGRCSIAHLGLPVYEDSGRVGVGQNEMTVQKSDPWMTAHGKILIGNWADTVGWPKKIYRDRSCRR